MIIHAKYDALHLPTGENGVLRYRWVALSPQRKDARAQPSGKDTLEIGLERRLLSSVNDNGATDLATSPLSQANRF